MRCAKLPLNWPSAKRLIHRCESDNFIANGHRMRIKLFNFCDEFEWNLLFKPL